MEDPEPCTGALIVRKDGKMLISKSPKWTHPYTVPGGHVEIGESIAESLKREVMEEVGLEVKVTKLINVQDMLFSQEFHKKKHFIFLNYLCEYLSGTPVVDGEEMVSADWYTPEEALKLDLNSFTKKFIEAHLSELEGNSDR